MEKICAPGDAEAFGLTCSAEEPCPIYLELAAIEESGSVLYLTGNLHSVNATLFGLLLISPDRGKSWSDKRIRSAELDQVQFVDADHGWVSGVALDPLARNPFFLITQDGGKSWKPSEVFEDPRMAVITRFWFDSANDGRMVVDASQGKTVRFERYETRNGGATWEQRETADQEIRLPQPDGPASSNWRVRVDGQSYRVESRTSGDWETAALFAIQAGECP